MLNPPAAPCSTIPTLNLTAGCAHGCLYCYARGYTIYPGEGRVRVYSNAPEKLRAELARKRNLPRAVSLSSASDPFQPVPQVLDVAYDVLEVLLEGGVYVSILTKGRIPERHMRLLLNYPSLVHARAGLITVNAQIASAFEPNCAQPEVRLAQLSRFASAGIPTQVRIDPILPGLTDDEGSFEHVCEAIAGAGVGDIAPSLLFLRPAITRALRRHLRGTDFLRRLMREFRDAIRLPIHDGASVVTAISTERRRAIYGRVQEAADRHGLRVRLCSCKNADLTAECCALFNEWPEQEPRPLQLSLFGDGNEARSATARRKARCDRSTSKARAPVSCR